MGTGEAIVPRTEWAAQADDDALCDALLLWAGEAQASLSGDGVFLVAEVVRRWREHRTGTAADFNAMVSEYGGRLVSEPPPAPEQQRGPF